IRDFHVTGVQTCALPISSKLLEDIEFKNMLSDEGDNLSAVLQITAGAGGTESCDWAGMLMRMYLMWAENNGYKVKELNFQAGDEIGRASCRERGSISASG